MFSVVLHLSFNNFIVGVYADIDKAIQIIKTEAEKLEFVIDNRTPNQVINDVPIFDVRLVEITETAIHLRAYIWLSEPLNEFKMKCILKKAVHQKFIEESIELPIDYRKIFD